MKIIKLLLTYAVVFGITYYYLSFYRNAFYDLTADEGYIIYGAKRLLDGQILYKDFFQYFPPGDFYLLALVFKLFGYGFIIARETAVIIDALINTLLFYLSYKAIRAWWAILPPLFFLILGFPNWMQFSHYWSSMLFLFISLAFFLGYLEKNKDVYLCLTGFFIGITGLFLQTNGMYAALLLLLVLILEKRKDNKYLKKLGLFLTSIGIPLIITFTYIAFRGAFVDFIKEQYFMSKVYAEAATFNPITLYFRHFDMYSVIFVLYAGTAILSGITFIFFRNKLSNSIKIILTGDVLLSLASSSRIDFEHMLVNSALIFIIVLLPIKWLLDYLENKNSPLYKGSWYLWNLIAISFIVWGIISIKANIYNIQTRANHINFNGVAVWTFNKKEAYEITEFFPKAIKILNDEKNVMVYPDGALIYVLMNFNNPAFIDWTPTLTGMSDYGPYGFYRAAQDLKKNKTNYIIYCSWPRAYINAVLSFGGKQYHINVLDEFIRDNYVPIERLDELILYKKR